MQEGDFKQEVAYVFGGGWGRCRGVRMLFAELAYPGKLGC